MNKLTAIAATAVLAMAASFKSDACTNILVTKGASADGSCMVSYAADSHQLFGELYFHPAADWKPGTMMQVYEWDTGKYLMDIPQVAHTYKTVGNMNEHQLIIGETTYGGREELYDFDNGIDYGSLIYITLQRARTAREAISTIVELADTWGYCSEGESFSIADTEEVWVMDLIGRGKGKKGIVWVARRVPDGYICAHANQSRISTFPQNDPENCMFSEDVISLAREKGWFDGKDEDFSFCDAYNPLDFGGMRGCESRAWSAFNILCDGSFTFMDENGSEVSEPASKYLPYAMGYDKNLRFPLFVKPARKVSVKAVADVMRDHFEGTPMDMTNDIGAGGNGLPYRWRPMYFESNGVEYCNERAIATQQTGFWFVAQARGWLPDVVGALNWFGTDDAATSYLTPIYANVNAVPECLREGNGGMVKYSPTSSFWLCNRVANACYRMYDRMAPVARKAADEFENAQMGEKIAEIDALLMKVYEPLAKSGRTDGWRAKRILRRIRKAETNYCTSTAQTQFEAWTALEQELLIRFIDGNVKDLKEDGSFELSQPGYTQMWKDAVAKDPHAEQLKTK